MQNRKGLSNFEKPVFDFTVLYPKESGLSKKLKVSTLDIWIKQSGLKNVDTNNPIIVIGLSHLLK